MHRLADFTARLLTDTAQHTMAVAGECRCFFRRIRFCFAFHTDSLSVWTVRVNYMIRRKRTGDQSSSSRLTSVLSRACVDSCCRCSSVVMLLTASRWDVDNSLIVRKCKYPNPMHNAPRIPTDPSLPQASMDSDVTTAMADTADTPLRIRCEVICRLASRNTLTYFPWSRGQSATRIMITSAGPD